jgi:hypothetical protein
MHSQSLARPVAWLPRILVCLAVNGCNTVDGGAVELSWKLRPASGSTMLFVDCDTGATMTTPEGLRGLPPVTRVRLDWQVGNTTGFTSWACTDYHGVTGFDLPEGTALLAISPECASGAAATTSYTAPAPEQRTVIVGNTISLGAVELVVEVTACTDTQPCICQ